jgi:mannose/cellobiose epimerase-like protein (N-acyl-D-glucosamine 2-epimerase family)
MDFYHPQCMDKEAGGFFHHFRDDGSIYDSSTRHLVSSARFIFNYSMASIHFNNDEYIEAARHGINFLRNCHLDKNTGGYRWLLEGKKAKDSTNYCYGLAFVLLAYSTAYKSGINEAKDHIDETFELMEKQFWIKEFELYSDEKSSDWTQESSYRGQNTNMHACEALIAAYEATNNLKYLDRALAISKSICIRF